jgi:hypothetical protein
LVAVGKTAYVQKLCFEKNENILFLSLLDKKNEFQTVAILICTDMIKKGKGKLSRYTSWWRLEGEEVLLLLILDLGTKWG